MSALSKPSTSTDVVHLKAEAKRVGNDLTNAFNCVVTLASFISISVKGFASTGDRFSLGDDFLGTQYPHGKLIATFLPASGLYQHGMI